MRHLSDELLLKETQVWVSKEREATLQLIAHLEEIELRKLYLARGFSSLFQFCVKYLKLSEGAASRRINAMRLTRDVPSVKEKLSSGELTLSSASLTQSFMKHLAPGTLFCEPFALCNNATVCEKGTWCSTV